MVVDSVGGVERCPMMNPPPNPAEKLATPTATTPATRTTRESDRTGAPYDAAAIEGARCGVTSVNDTSLNLGSSGATRLSGWRCGGWAVCDALRGWLRASFSLGRSGAPRQRAARTLEADC